jgi:hypothetical protein
VRGAEAARRLKELRAKRILIRAAKLGYITEVTCGMPECFCPEQLGGPRYFEPVSAELSDWSPTHEHFPVPKREGGKATPDNTILAHRLCNRIDYSKAVGRSHRRDLERIRKAREAAAAADLSQSAPDAEAVPEVFAPEPASPAKSPRKRKAAAWKSLPPAELAAHLLATLTIADSAWTTEPRLPGENRESFIRRIVLGEIPESPTEDGAA